MEETNILGETYNTLYREYTQAREFIRLFEKGTHPIHIFSRLEVLDTTTNRKDYIDAVHAFVDQLILDDYQINREMYDAIKEFKEI
nr:hypothetical protein ORM20_00103 [Ochrobactrum phage ORM_20]